LEAILCARARRHKLLLVITILLFMILTNYNLAIAVKEQLSPIRSNFWSLLIKDVSEQVIASKVNHAGHIMFYRLLKPQLFKPGIFSYFSFRPLLSSFVNRFNVRYKISFFTIYYQLSRTSSEKSDPLCFN
jgi:hypothetical protein